MKKGLGIMSAVAMMCAAMFNSKSSVEGAKKRLNAGSSQRPRFYAGGTMAGMFNYSMIMAARQKNSRGKAHKYASGSAQ